MKATPEQLSKVTKMCQTIGFGSCSVGPQKVAEDFIRQHGIEKALEVAEIIASVKHAAHEIAVPLIEDAKLLESSR